MPPPWLLEGLPQVQAVNPEPGPVNLSHRRGWGLVR